MFAILKLMRCLMGSQWRCWRRLCEIAREERGEHTVWYFAVKNAVKIKNWHVVCESIDDRLLTRNVGLVREERAVMSRTVCQHLSTNSHNNQPSIITHCQHYDMASISSCGWLGGVMVRMLDLRFVVQFPAITLPAIFELDDCILTINHLGI